ncbi:MAG: chitobiase/beta-hexosaminidase C-terminal domain-containing protein [Prevotella sp.]|nr:chitobiase/beta-hexosaminidase C-terminal domain-containing protein [Prevotella sp.]
MNKFRLFAFFIVSVLSSVTAYAYDVEINGIYYNINQSAKTAEITSGDNPYPYSDLTIPESIVYNGVRYAVTSVGEWAFNGCENLSTLTIPATLTSMGHGAFYYCNLLRDIYICSAKPNCHIENDTFDYYTETEATFYVPTGTTYYHMAQASEYGWPSLTPFGIGLSELGYDERINLKEFDYDYEGVNVNLKCLDDEGNDITQSVKIGWYPSEEWYELVQQELLEFYFYRYYIEQNPELLDDEKVKALYEFLINFDPDIFYMKVGSSLGKTPINTELCYAIELTEEMGRLYHEPPVQKAMVEKSDVTFVCQLQKIQKVNLSGRVVASDIDEKTATVHVKQMLNKKYEETFTTQTNSKGEFSLEVYDDDTEIIVSCDGYMDVTIHRSGFNGNGNLGQITLTPITGFVIPVNIECTPVADDEEVTDDLLPGGLYDLELTLRNETTSDEITDYSVQYNGSLIIKSGVSAWDDICVTAKSKKHVLADAHTTFYLDEEGTNTIDLNFVELGGLSATFSESANNNNAGYLYNSEGQLVTRGVYSGETLRLKHINAGTYTLISIGQSSLLSNITYLTRLSQLNLVEGKDYLSSQVEIKDGETTVVSAGAIPKLNQSLFLFEGSLATDKSSVIVGDFVAFSAKVNIDEDLYEKINDVHLTIDLPEGCKFVENSVLVNRSTHPYTLNGNTLNINLSKKQAQGEIRWCLSPVKSGNYRVVAYASFDKEITTPRSIGVAHFEGEELSFNLPFTTSKTNIQITGLTIPNSEVKIYDGTVKIGETTSKGDGTWAAQCELYNAYNLSDHDIIVKAKTPEGKILTSNVKNIVYNEKLLLPSKISMTFYNDWHKDNITVDFDLINGTTSQKHYDFFHETDFTFLAYFNGNDTTFIQDVNFKVKATDGTIRTLPAVFDGRRQAWVATSRYDSNKLPENVTVDFDYILEETDESRQEGLRDQAASMAAFAGHVYNFIEDNLEMRVVDQDETSATVNYWFPGLTTNCRYHVESMAFSEAEKMMRNYQFIYSTADDGVIGTYTELTDNSIMVVLVDLDEKAAFRITISDSNQYSKRKSWGKTPKKSFFKDVGSSLADNLLDILGIAEYVNVKKDFDRMLKRLDNFKDKYAQKRQDTFNKLVAKCPDGTERLTKQLRGNFSTEMQTKIWPEENELAKKYDDYLKEYKQKLAWSVSTFAATFALGKFMKTARFVNSKLNQAFQKTLVRGTSLETSAETLSGLIGTASGSAIDKLDKIFAYKDFNAIKDKARSWSSKQNAQILKLYADLNQRIEKAYKSCVKKEESTPENRNDTDGKQETFVENVDNNTVTFTTQPVQPILDPSGYVYEAVLSNRLPGVTTTVYQKQLGNAVKWNAEDYSQENPLVTDEAGFYRWDVPMGEWQVKYEKEGYETCYSDWLPVPPPQLDVNVGMKQTIPPAVKKMRGAESGITIEMSKYMLPESLNENTIIVSKDRMSQNGRVELLNSEQSPTGDASYVSKVKFVPEERFHAGDEVYVTVKKDVESYCSVKMGADHTEIVVIEPEITAIVIDSVLTIPYDSTRTVQALVMPKEVSAGKILKAHLSSNLIASINEEVITIDENGLATFELGGELPGSALLTLTLDNMDISAQSKVKVDMEYETVSTPTASIRNGSEVEIGTLLSLSCATPGATIYYTLDGSCPCNEETRILYTEPFVLPKGVVMVKVIAVEDYLYDSDVVTFIYEVKEPSGIKARSESEHSFNVSYANGMIVIENVEGGSCMIYDMAGRELSGRTRLLEHDTVPVSKADAYVICVRFADGSTTVRKIVRH